MGSSNVESARRDGETQERDSGIPVMGNISWGSHFCQFYGSEDDHVATVADYFTAGLEMQEACLWVTGGVLSQEAGSRALQDRDPRFRDWIASGALELIGSEEWYLREQRFEPERVARAWEAKLETALEGGYAGLRVAGNEEWLTHDVWPAFARYESTLNRKLAGKKMLILCCYPLRRRSAEEVFEIADSHQFALARRDGAWHVMEASTSVGANAETLRLNDELSLSIYERTRQLEAVSGALVENEELFHFLADNTLDLVSLHDLKGRTVYASPSYAKVLGRVPEDFFADVHPQDRDQLAEAWEGLVEGDAQSLSYRHHGDGTAWRWLETSATRVAYRGANHILAASRDITERTILEDQLRHSQKMEALGRLAGGVAHDFNNMLTSIFGYAGLIANSLPQDGESLGYAREIEASAERARRLTKQLLTFARRDVHQRRTIDVAAATRKLEKMLRLIVREDVEFSITSGSEALPAFIDLVQFEQVLLNLVVNARQAVLAGGRIAIACSHIEIPPQRKDVPTDVPDGSYVLLNVADTGEGIAPDLLERVFEPFFTTKPAGEGTGLGLSTVFGIVKQSSGFVWLESEPGSGTVAHVLLPLQKRCEQSRPDDMDPPAGGNIAGLHVLVVEDDDAVRRFVVEALRRNGAMAQAYADPEEALKALQAYPDQIDLLLCDLVLPSLVGTKVAKLAKSLKPDLKILLMSGYSPEEVDLNVNDEIPLMEKPFGEAELVKCISMIFNIS